MLGKTNIAGAPKVPQSAQVEYFNGPSEKSITFNFTPSIVMLAILKVTGEMKTSVVQKFKNASGAWVDVGGVSNIHNYYDGSGGSNFGRIASITDAGCTISGLTSSAYCLIVLP